MEKKKKQPPFLAVCVGRSRRLRPRTFSHLSPRPKIKINSKRKKRDPSQPKPPLQTHPPTPAALKHDRRLKPQEWNVRVTKMFIAEGAGDYWSRSTRPKTGGRPRGRRGRHSITALDLARNERLNSREGRGLGRIKRVI